MISWSGQLGWFELDRASPRSQAHLVGHIMGVQGQRQTPLAELLGDMRKPLGIIIDGWHMLKHMLKFSRKYHIPWATWTHKFLYYIGRFQKPGFSMFFHACCPKIRFCSIKKVFLDHHHIMISYIDSGNLLAFAVEWWPFSQNSKNVWMITCDNRLTQISEDLSETDLCLKSQKGG